MVEACQGARPSSRTIYRAVDTCLSTHAFKVNNVNRSEEAMITIFVEGSTLKTEENGRDLGRRAAPGGCAPGSPASSFVIKSIIGC